MTGPDDPAWRWEFRVEDFVYARLAEAQTAADALPTGPGRDAELNRIDSLYLIASEHNIWVDARGQSAGRCITCTISGSGVPCLTMTGLARMWRQHPDYQPGWNRAIDDPGSGSGSTYREYKQRTTIYQRRAAELLPFYDRFDLDRDRNGEYWQCRTCPARGESWLPPIGMYDHPFAIEQALKQHPTCPALENKEPTT